MLRNNFLKGIVMLIWRSFDDVFCNGDVKVDDWFGYVGNLRFLV